MTDSKSIGTAYRDQSIVGGSIDNSPIGATTPSTGVFTTVTASGGITITGTIAGPVAATTLSASGASTLNGNVAIGNATTDLVGFHGATAVDQGAALTAQLTTITPADAEGTPDYAIQAITQTTPFGFVNAQECITLLYVVKNLQERLAEVEQRLEEKGLIAAN